MSHNARTTDLKPQASGFLGPYQLADLPPKTKSFWQLCGPAAIMVGMSIGAGEIVVWPRITAIYGAGMCWAAIFGVFVQYWINLEIARYTMATGESSYTGFMRVWRPLAMVFIALNILGWIQPGWARMSGGALKALIVGEEGWGQPWQWAAITFGIVAFLLFGPKLVYKSVEITIFGLITIIVVGLVIVGLKVGDAHIWGELGRGLLHVGYKDPAMPIKEFFIALVFAGAGGTSNLFLAYWLRDKNLAMGDRIPDLMSAFRGEHTEEPISGYLFPETESNVREWRKWFRHVHVEQFAVFWFLNSFTMLLFMFGSLAVLHPLVQASGRPPPVDESFIYWESQVLHAIWGDAGRIIFLLVGVATLFSTQLALVDGVARSISDILYVRFPAARKRSLSWWYALVAGAWIVIGTLWTATVQQSKSALSFLYDAAFMGGVGMAVYVPLMLYVNHRFLPRSIRPSWVHTGLNIGASLLYIAFCVFSLVEMLRPK